jgi:hypothetical protein
MRSCGVALPNERGASARRLIRQALRAATPFLLVAGVIAVRFPTPLLRAEFWAEDATEFFFDAVSLGPRSLIEPVYGYHFVLEHLVAYAATFLPVFYTPYVYAWSCLVVDAAALAYLARDGFSWIAPLRWQRVALAMLLALGPGTADVLLNFANLPNPLALLGFLLLIERPFQMRWRKVLLFALIAVSSGHVLIWFPVAAYLAWTNRSRGHAAAAVIIAGIAFINASGVRDASSSAGSLNPSVIAEVPRIVIENGFARLLAGPFLGLGPAGVFQRAPALVYWPVLTVSLALFAWLAVREAARERDGTVVLLLGYAGAIAMLGLVAISRSYNVPVLVRDSGSLIPHVRYSFLPAALATFIWSAWLLRPRPQSTARRVLRYAAAMILALHLAAGFPLRFDRLDLAWHERSERVQALLDLNRATGQAVVITMGDLAIHPVGWRPDNRRFAVLVRGR